MSQKYQPTSHMVLFLNELKVLDFFSLRLQLKSHLRTRMKSDFTSLTCEERFGSDLFSVQNKYLLVHLAIQETDSDPAW